MNWKFIIVTAILALVYSVARNIIGFENTVIAMISTLMAWEFTKNKKL